MTKERREEVVLLALVVSVALHVGLMIFVRPEVMVHVGSSGRHVTRRAPMRVTKPADAERPRSLDELLDLKPLREAPKADSLAVREPVLPSAEAAVAAPDLPASVPDPIVPKVDAAHFDQPALRLDDTVSERLELPKIEVLKPSGASRAPQAETVVAAPKLAPGPTVSAPSVTLAPEPAPAPVALPRPAADSTPPIVFKPATEVFEKVDEQVVEAEKASVRQLVNATDAAELAAFANVALVTERRADGLYFSVLVTPRHELGTIPKDVVVLLDASGSIGKDRMGSIRKAAKRLLRSATNTGDRFNLVAFRDRYSYAFRQWQPCTQRAFDASDRWLNDVAPHGRTDVFSTIASVLTLPRDPVRPLIALVVTDGDANEGVTDNAEILSRFTKLNDGLVSVYMYGIKSSANRELIDVLTHGNRGESFIFDGWRWNAGDGIDGLSTRFRDPVLSDLRLVFPSSVRAEAYPLLLRNLYRGETLEIHGRIAGTPKEISFSLKGQNAGKAYEGYFSLPVSTASSAKGVAAAWERERVIAARLLPRQ